MGAAGPMRSGQVNAKKDNLNGAERQLQIEDEYCPVSLQI